MATRCIESIVIDSPNTVFVIPSDANYMATKHGRCIFAHVNPHPEDKYFPIPVGSKEVCFPEYRKHGDRYIFYGQPVFISSD